MLHALFPLAIAAALVVGLWLIRLEAARQRRAAQVERVRCERTRSGRLAAHRLEPALVRRCDHLNGRR